MRLLQYFNRSTLVMIIIILLLSISSLAQNKSHGEIVFINIGFKNPEPVTILGYDGDAMEPFITRDGRYLFFNNLNSLPDTNIFYAERIDDVTFNFKGEIEGINSTVLDAVASMDESNRLFFISTRSYFQTFSTIYQSQFADGKASEISLVADIGRHQSGYVNFDAEISADGNTLYYVDGRYASNNPNPIDARLMIAKRSGATFAATADSDQIMQNINSDANALVYAPATSVDELELFFTRFDKSSMNQMPAIYMSYRKSRNEIFSAPIRLAAITGFVEAPTISPDGKSLYYHKKVDNHFSIFRVTR